MGETTITMTVAEARQRLQNTSAMSAEQVSDLRQVVDAFYAARPIARACLACRCMQWSEHTSKDGNAVWACASCHRSPDLTAEAWHAQQTRERKAADAHLRATAAAAPKPRETLREALTRLAEAKAGLVKHEAALPPARSTLTAAQLRHERAEAEATAIDAKAAEHLANSFLGGRAAGGPAPSAAAARAALASATDGLAAARAAKALLDEKLSDQRTTVATAQAATHRAATRVIAAERLEDLLTAATEGRANYLESVGALGWLLREHAIPLNDRRAHQILGEANTPPSAWPEAKEAGTAQMEAMRAALMADPEAII